MGKYERSAQGKKTGILFLRILLPLATLLIGFLAAFLIFGGNSSALPLVPEESTAPVVKNPDSIAIPGYESITLEADQKEQTIAFSNPAQNTCLFVMTLRLEDGTVLWRSKEIKPGKTSKPVVLEQVLPVGTYPNAVLEYECFQDNSERTKLNGATMKVTLQIR